MNKFLDSWDDEEATVAIERNPRLIVCVLEELGYTPPPAGRYDNDCPTLTEIPAIGCAP